MEINFQEATAEHVEKGLFIEARGELRKVMRLNHDLYTATTMFGGDEISWACHGGTKLVIKEERDRFDISDALKSFYPDGIK